MTMRTLAILFALLAVGLLFGQFVSLAPLDESADDGHFARKVNLALRRTAHQLLVEQGDSTSRILPVQQSNTTTFLIRLERPFDYSRLPVILQESLHQHQIEQNYDVAVLDCVNGELQLGYNVLDIRDHASVPCEGRQQTRSCYNLQVVFNRPAQASWPVNPWVGWGMGLLLLGGAYVAWTKATKHPAPEPAKDSNQIELGQTAFCLANQSVVVAGVPHTLTYREAKLLNLFAHHPNQLLERDFILKAVWEDEGIIVGRSVDVFVSRLRKLLQPDPALRIVAVHGVGYRLEVRSVPADATS